MSTELGLKEKDNKTYINILASDGTLRRVVPEGTPNSVVRTYETSDGKSGTKHELIYKEVSGYITDMQFYEGEYGTNLVLDIAINEEKTEGITLSLGTGSAFGEDFMKKLPNIDLAQIVTLSPYAFDDENGKTKRGISITQGTQKITNYFYDPEKKEVINGYPKTKGDTKKYTKDKWKAYFLEARIFLTEYTNEHFVKEVFKHVESDPNDF